MCKDEEGVVFTSLSLSLSPYLLLKDLSPLYAGLVWELPSHTNRQVFSNLLWTLTTEAFVP